MFAMYYMVPLQNSDIATLILEIKQIYSLGRRI